MNYSNYRINLDVQAAASSVLVSAKRGDTGRKLYITLNDGGLPYRITSDCLAVFTATKPDGHIVFNECVIDGNTVVYAIREQTVAVAGKVNCELRLYGAEGMLITSACFALVVDGTVYTEGDEIESTDDFSALTKLLTDILKLKEELEALLGGGTGEGGNQVVINNFVEGLVKNESFINKFIEEITKNETITSTFVEKLLKDESVINKFVEEVFRSESFVNNFVEELLKDESVVNNIVEELAKNETVINSFVEEIVRNDSVINKFVEEVLKDESVINTLLEELVKNETVINSFIEEVLKNENIAQQIADAMPKVTAIDFSNFENGSFTETVGGETVTHTVAFDSEGRPVLIDAVTITWGAV